MHHWKFVLISLQIILFSVAVPAHPLDWACAQQNCSTQPALQALDRAVVSCHLTQQSAKCDQLAKEFPEVADLIPKCNPEGVCQAAHEQLDLKSFAEACYGGAVDIGKHIYQAAISLPNAIGKLGLIAGAAVQAEIRRSREYREAYFEVCRSDDPEARELLTTYPDINGNWQNIGNLGSHWEQLDCNEMFERTQAFYESIKRTNSINDAVHLNRSQSPLEFTEKAKVELPQRIWNCTGPQGKAYFACYMATLPATVGGIKFISWLRKIRAAKRLTKAEGALALTEATTDSTATAVQVSDGRAMRLATEAIGRERAMALREAIVDAHHIGDGEPGRIPGTLAEADNYTLGQLRRKRNRLVKDGANAEEVRKLMDAEAVGTRAAKDVDWSAMNLADQQATLESQYVQLKQAGFGTESSDLIRITQKDLKTRGVGMTLGDVQKLYQRALQKFKGTDAPNGFRHLQEIGDETYYQTLSRSEQLAHNNGYLDRLRDAGLDTNPNNLRKITDEELRRNGLFDLHVDEIHKIPERLAVLNPEIIPVIAPTENIQAVAARPSVDAAVEPNPEVKGPSLPTEPAPPSTAASPSPQAIGSTPIVDLSASQTSPLRHDARTPTPAPSRTNRPTLSIGSKSAAPQPVNLSASALQRAESTSFNLSLYRKANDATGIARGLHEAGLTSRQLEALNARVAARGDLNNPQYRALMLRLDPEEQAIVNQINTEGYQTTTFVMRDELVRRLQGLEAETNGAQNVGTVAVSPSVGRSPISSPAPQLAEPPPNIWAQTNTPQRSFLMPPEEAAQVLDKTRGRLSWLTQADEFNKLPEDLNGTLARMERGRNPAERAEAQHMKQTLSEHADKPHNKLTPQQRRLFSEDSWNILRSNRSLSTFYDSAEHRLRTLSNFEREWSKSPPSTAIKRVDSTPNEVGAVRYHYEVDGEIHEFLICAQPRRAGCKKPGDVVEYHPKCGPHIQAFNPSTYRASIRLSTTASTTGLIDVPCP